MKLKAILILCLLAPLIKVAPVQAKTWDPRLLEASKKAYLGQIPEATQLVEAYIQENPEDPNGLFIKALVLNWKATYDVENWDQSQRNLVKLYEKASNMAFQRWHFDPDNVDKMIDLGNSYLFLGKKYSDVGSWFKAILTGKKCQQHLDKALQLDPNRPEAKFTLGGFRYVADNAPPGARAFRGLFGIKGDRVAGLQMMRESAQGEHPFKYDAQMTTYYFYYEYEKNYPEAAKWLQGMLQEFPNNPELKWRWAKVSEKLQPGQPEQEYLNFAKWCIDNPKDCHSQFVFLGYYDAGKLVMGQGKADRAFEYFQQALNYDKMAEINKRAEIYLWMGQMEEGRGKHTEALLLYKKAAEVPGLSKEVKKSVDDAKEKLCQKAPGTGSC